LFNYLLYLFQTKILSFSRTLTSVHDAILHDLVYPAEITGKRIRIKTDGSRLFKVHLDKNQQTLVENKVYYSLLTFISQSFYFSLGSSFSIDL
jgi:small subunit ribosomal protein S7e